MKWIEIRNDNSPLTLHIKLVIRSQSVIGLFGRTDDCVYPAYIGSRTTFLLQEQIKRIICDKMILPLALWRVSIVLQILRFEKPNQDWKCNPKSTLHGLAAFIDSAFASMII